MSEPPCKRVKRNKHPTADIVSLRVLSPIDPSYYYSCTRLYYLTEDIINLLKHVDVFQFTSHLKHLFRAWTNPHLFQELYQRADGTFVTGFRCDVGDQKVSDRAHIFIDSPGRRTNNGARGSRKGKWNSWERYLTYYACGKFSYRPFKKHPITSAIPMDHHDMFMDSWVKMKGGQGNSSAAKVREAWTDPENNNVYDAARIIFTTEETVEDCVNEFQAPCARISRPITAEDIVDMRYAYSAGQYWHVSAVYENDVKMSHKNGFVCEDRHAAEDVRELWQMGGPTMDEWSFSETSYDALCNDVSDFLYALKIIASHPDKMCVLSLHTREQWSRIWNRDNICQKAKDIFQEIQNPALDMLRTLQYRL
jgi:hypothetical protein